jgi:hypothetical protein
MYILTKRNTDTKYKSIEKLLKDMTTYQSDGVVSGGHKHFSSTIQKLYNMGLLLDAESCFLSPAGMDVMKTIINAYIGTHKDTIPFNGVEIFEGGVKLLKKTWIDPVEQALKETFGCLEKFSITQIDKENKRKDTIYLVETNTNNTSLVLYFPHSLNLEPNELNFIDKYCSYIVNQNEKKQPDKQNLSMGIIFAPTYTYHASNDATSGFIKRYLMGPINFAILMNHLKLNNKNRIIQYNQFIEYFHSDSIEDNKPNDNHKDTRAGIVDAHKLIKFIGNPED